MPPLQPWHDFFILVGTAAATLLGLVFVAASIAATIPNEKLGDRRQRATWVLPIMYAFLRVLVVCALGVMPSQTERSFGWLLAGLAFFDLVRMGWVWRELLRFHRSAREPLDASDWTWYVAYPSVATCALIASGASFALAGPVPLYVLAMGLLGHLVVGVRNAWELADFLATLT
jgi:hypothetical protein